MSLQSLTMMLLASAAPAPEAAPAPAEPVQTSAPSTADDQAESTAAIPANSNDITVTARRREEKVQDVPIAISVVRGEELERTGTQNVGQLTQIQPSVQFFSTNPRNSAANIRGLGAPFGLTNDGIEQGVGIYIDQVYYSRIAAATFDFLDVERVEVLRGPQGTLYGKNTTAGAVNITSRAPTFTPEGRLEISIGNLGYVQAKGSVSGPLVEDTVAVRLAASATHRRGTIFNVTTGSWQNERENLGFRGQLLYRAADNLDLTLSADYNTQNPECCVQIYVREGATQRPLNRQFASLAAAFGYAPPSKDPFDRLADVDTELRAKQTLGGVALRAEWDLGPGVLTSVSAWRFWDWDPSNDRDFTALPITTISANPSKQRQVTQEFRYASSGVNTLDYVFGAFIFHQTLNTSGVQEQGEAASRFLLNPACIFNNTSPCNAANPAVLNGLRAENDISFTNTSAALFGQLTWRITDKLRVQPGIRLNYDKKDGSYESVVTTGTGSTTLNNDQRGVLGPQSYEAHFSKWNLSYDFTLSYDFAPDVLGYATYARSFKSGGINLSGLPLDATNNPILSAGSVRPEKVNHFELGLKTQLFDRKATLNLSGYWTEIDDYQATVTNGQLGVLRGYLANAEKVRVRGFELEFNARPSERFSIYSNAAYTDGEYVKFTDAPCPPELSGGTTVGAGQTPSAPGTPGGLSPASCDVSGQWLPGISKWSLSFGGEYNVPANILGTDGQFYLGYDGNYRTKFSSNPSRSAYTDIEGYSISNFRAGFRTDDKWNIYGWVRNAFNEEYFEVLALQSGNTGLVVGQPGDQRTYGVTVSKSF